MLNVTCWRRLGFIFRKARSTAQSGGGGGGKLTTTPIAAMMIARQGEHRKAPLYNKTSKCIVTRKSCKGTIRRLENLNIFQSSRSF